MPILRRVALLLALIASHAAPLSCGGRTDLLAGELPYAPSVADSGADAVKVVSPAAPIGVQGLIYVVTNMNTLLEFNPETATFSVIGASPCNDPLNPEVSAMAVDQNGIAYIEYFSSSTGNTSEVFRVNLETLSCAPSGIHPASAGLTAFGMAFALDDSGTSETLYLSDFFSGELAAFNPANSKLSVIGTTAPIQRAAELASTGDGSLYAFVWTVGDGAISELDKNDAHALASYTLSGVAAGDGWAFVSYGDDFYLFTSPVSGSGSVVTRFHPADGTTTQVATYPEMILGAGQSSWRKTP